MAKRKRRRKRAAEQFPDTRTIVAPPKTPEWLKETIKTETKTVARPGPSLEVTATDEVPEDLVDVTGWSEKKTQMLWTEILRDRLPSNEQAAKLYKTYAGMSNAWGIALDYIDVLKKGEPVGWYDLDAGLIEYVTVYDLLFTDQPMIPREGKAEGRKLFMMTEEMWENEEYPPEVGGKTTSKER